MKTLGICCIALPFLCIGLINPMFYLALLIFGFVVGSIWLGFTLLGIDNKE